MIDFQRIPDEELWWCNVHQRRAHYISLPAHRHFCTGPGIMLPCSCVNLTGIAVIEEANEILPSTSA
jgi:hypothetical protein